MRGRSAAADGSVKLRSRHRWGVSVYGRIVALRLNPRPIPPSSRRGRPGRTRTENPGTAEERTKSCIARLQGAACGGDQAFDASLILEAIDVPGRVRRISLRRDDDLVRRIREHIPRRSHLSPGPSCTASWCNRSRPTLSPPSLEEVLSFLAHLLDFHGAMHLESLCSCTYATRVDGAPREPPTFPLRNGLGFLRFATHSQLTELRCTKSLSP